jgi:hypothetical protein
VASNIKDIFLIKIVLKMEKQRNNSSPFFQHLQLKKSLSFYANKKNLVLIRFFTGLQALENLSRLAFYVASSTDT